MNYSFLFVCLFVCFFFSYHLNTVEIEVIVIETLICVSRKSKLSSTYEIPRENLTWHLPFGHFKFTFFLKLVTKKTVLY